MKCPITNTNILLHQTNVSEYTSMKVLLHCAIFSATCRTFLATPLWSKLLARELQEVEFRSTFRNALQQLAAPLHSVIPLQELFSDFFSRTLHSHAFISLLWNDMGTRRFELSSAKNIESCWERLHSVTGLFFPRQHASQGVATQVTEKIAQCT